MQGGGVLEREVDALGADRAVRVRTVPDQDEAVARPLLGVRGEDVEQGELVERGELLVQQVRELRQHPRQFAPDVLDPAARPAPSAVRQGPADPQPVGMAVLDQDSAAAGPVHPDLPGGPAGRVQREPHHVVGEGVRAPGPDPGQRPGLGEPSVRADHGQGAYGDGRPVGAPGDDPGARAAGPLLQQGRHAVALQVREAGQLPAGVQESGQQVRLREGQQVVVRGGQPPVVDVEKHPVAVQHLEAGQGERTAGPRRSEDAELVEDALAARLEDLAVKLPPQGGGTLDERHADAGAQQHEGQCQPGGPGADDAHVGLGLGAGGGARIGVVHGRCPSLAGRSGRSGQSVSGRVSTSALWNPPNPLPRASTALVCW